MRKSASAALLLMACQCTGLQAQSDATTGISLRLDDVLSPLGQIVAPEGTADRMKLPAPGQLSCRELPSFTRQRLTLMHTIEHVLCKSPPLNQALLLVEEQQAGVDLAASSFRPRISARAELAANGVPSSNSGSGFLGASVTGSLGLSWVLFDAGARQSLLAQSRQGLNAARAGQQTAALNAVNDALRLYVEAAVASSRLSSLRESEDVAAQSLQVAQAKHDAQVASLSERLQAQTALAQASLDRVRAQGTWETARGALAVSMGYSADEPLTLASFGAAFPGTSAAVITRERIALAMRDHPRMQGARADLLALKSRLDAIRADGQGNVTLSMGAGSTRDLRTPGSSFEHSISGYVIASVPIFNGSEQLARENQVMAQIASREAAVTQVERDIELDLWRNARSLETESQNLEAAKLLLDTAGQSYQVALGRYKAGVGAILELMGTQVALSAARSQLTQAQFGHAQARLRLEIAFGNLVLSP